MFNDYEARSNGLMNVDGGLGEIKKSEFRKFIHNLTKKEKAYLNCPGVNKVFNDKNNIITKVVEDMAYFVVGVVNTIMKENMLANDDMLRLAGINSIVCETAFRVRSISEIFKPNEAEDIIRIRTDMRRMLKEYIEYVQKIMPQTVSEKIVFKNNVKKNIYARINSTEFLMVLTNLIVNALMHSHSVKKRVEVILNHVDNKVAVSVLDYGIGVDIKKISAVMNKKITELEKGVNDVQVYKGCGLIVCQKLAENMNGEILVSNYPGAGAVFTVMLDAAEEETDSGIYMLSDVVQPAIDFEKGMVFMAYNQLI